MADSDPISDDTPRKRQKRDGFTNESQAWDSEDDGDEEFTVDDFETEPTIPLPPPLQQLKRPHASSAFHSNPDSMALNGSRPPRRPHHAAGSASQTLASGMFGHVTQPTQALPSKPSSPPRSDVLVERSSPTQPAASPPAPAPAPIQRAPFAKPRSSLLASTLAPAGTGFRAPPGVQRKPEVVDLDSSDESDPPIHHSSDEGETQGLRSNLQPTYFQKSGRGLGSTPEKSHEVPSVQESPAASDDVPHASSNSATYFSSLLGNFRHEESPRARNGPQAARDDMASAYGSVSRAPRPSQPQRPAGTPPAPLAVRYETLDDVEDWSVRRKIENMQRIFPHESIQRCHDALMKTRGNQDNAMTWLADHEEHIMPPTNDVDELGSMSPPVKRGVAMSRSTLPSRSSQPARPAAKQEVKAPSRTIAEKYGSTQPRRKPSQPSTQTLDSDDEVVQPRRRLLQGRRTTRTPTPPFSPPALQQKQRLKQRQTVVIDDDDDEGSDSGAVHDESEEAVEPAESDFEARLLKFFNECSTRDLADLSAQPEDIVSFVLDKRPFGSLDEIRAISNASGTKSGRKSKSRPVGDKIVDICTDMWKGYGAVDDLVAECEKIAKPIQTALKGWGVGEGDGELQLMNLDEAHDSGIGTPASSCPSDDTLAFKRKSKSRFLGQPENMGDVELKDYQLVGLNWLNLLWSKKLSCILADDMGLGKTCQVISFLAHLQTQEVDGVHLVIVPGSTLENWLREFARFAPSLKVVPYYGGQKDRPELQDQINSELDTIDVVVTTYDMSVKPDDNKFLRRLEPAVCVYDEAHTLRNPTSNRYEQLTRIKADFKILLTGTPLQNNLQELVAILAFIMPGLFREKREDLDFIFKHKASTKDADHAALLSAERIARARTMMTPFILRRKKAQVLDLPTKHSRVEWCDMTATQAACYGTLVAEAQQVLAEKAASTSKRKMAVKDESSNILMQLRKAAIHPLLLRRIYNEKKIDKIVTALLQHEEFGGNTAEKVRAYLTDESNTGVSLKGGDYALHKFCAERPYLHKFELKRNEWMDCGKVQKFKELVTGYAANGDRILVFSQFTTLMDILEAVLETMEIKFMRLDGSTKMEVRQDMIDQFATDARISVFMLSTKAGGAGINLASANKVIIFDSGFNPQDDIQAENRAHRVGQTKEVEVVRLVSRGTIEEQIHALGESKLALDERVAGEGATATAAAEKQAEKQAEKVVERMLLESLQKGQQQPQPDHGAGGDLKDAFKAGMEGAGVKIASKQARY